MDQSIFVLLAVDKAHTVPYRGTHPGGGHFGKNDIMM